MPQLLHGLASQRAPRALLLAGVTLFAALAAARLALGDVVTTCDHMPWTRSANPDRDGTALLTRAHRDLMSFTLMRALAVSCAALQACFPGRRRSALRAAVAACVLLALFFPGILVAELGKLWLGDTACTGDRPHANSVSGHSFYFAYMLFVVALLTQTWSRWARLAAVAAAMLLVLPNWWLTLYYAYHSVQQVVLGVVWALLYSAGAHLVHAQLAGRSL